MLTAYLNDCADSENDDTVTDKLIVPPGYICPVLPERTIEEPYVSGIVSIAIDLEYGVDSPVERLYGGHVCAPALRYSRDREEMPKDGVV